VAALVQAHGTSQARPSRSGLALFVLRRESSSALDPLADRRMRVQQKFNPRRRLDLGEILIRQFFHRPDECVCSARRLQRVRVRHGLAPPRVRVAQRGREQTERAERERQERERGKVGDPGVTHLRYTPFQELIGDVQAGDCDKRLDDERPANVVMDVVAQFVREDRFDFVGRVLFVQRISQDDASRVAQAHQCGVRGGRLRGKHHREHAAHARVGARRERSQARDEFCVLQGFEFEKERQDEYGSEVREDEVEEEHERACPHPPPHPQPLPCQGRGEGERWEGWERQIAAQQRVDHFDHQAAKHDAERAAFRDVHQPGAQCLRGESVTMRQHKTAVVREREKQRAVRDQRDRKIRKGREPDVARDGEDELLEPDVQPESKHGDERERGQRDLQREQAMAEARVLFGLALAGGGDGHGGLGIRNWRLEIGRGGTRMNAQEL